MLQSSRMESDTPKFSSMLLAIAPERIAMFKAIIESYDNLATLRTEDPRRHYLRLTFAANQAGDVEDLIEALAPDFSIHRLDAD